MASTNSVPTHDVGRIEATLKREFKDVRAYRYNSASIRVRVVDPCFANKSRAQREESVWPVLAKLPEDLRTEITMLLLLEPGEQSLLNLEFEKPFPSLL